MGDKSKNVQTITPHFAAPPPTVATTNLQNQVDTPVDFAAPIRSGFARAKQGINKINNNPLGAYTTADVREKSLRSANSEIDQNLGIALGEAAQQSSSDKFNRQATVAGLTNPQFYNRETVNAQKFTAFDGIQLGLQAASGGLA